MYHKFLELVRANEYKIKHGRKDFVKQEWVGYVEQQLGFPLPDSYKWWVHKFEYFRVNGEYVRHITPPGHSDLTDMDILYTYKTSLENGVMNENQLTILIEGEGDEIYYFFVEPGIKGNEYKVCCRNHITDDEDFYADNFLKFLEMKIHEMV